MNEIWMLIQTPITSLLSALIICFSYIQVKKQTGINNEVKTKNSIIVMFFLLSILLFPLAFYFSGLLSQQALYDYIRETIISAMVVIPFMVLWEVLGKAVSSLQAYVASSQIEKLSFIENLDLTGKVGFAMDDNVISEEEANRAKTLRSLRKWIVQENEIGWYELRGQISDTSKLTDLQAQWLVLRELDRIQEQKETNPAHIRNHNYEQRLRSLVEDSPVGAVWKDWKSEEEVDKAYELYNFKKWALENDETGWASLSSILEYKKRLSSQVVECAKFELWEIEKTKKRGGFFDAEKEKRLKKLITA